MIKPISVIACFPIFGFLLLSCSFSRALDVKADVWHVMVPDGLQVRDGNTASFLPFLDDFGVNGRVRYQQVFASSAFQALPPGGAYLTLILVRTDCLETTIGGSFSTTNFGIWFSTTSKDPDHLSPVFAENIGLDVVKVRGGDALYGISGPMCPNPGPEFPLGPRIDLDIPFAYDPSKGNLLMEIQIQGKTAPLPPRRFRLDAENVLGDPISRVAGRGFDAPVADIAQDTTGIPVYFSFFGPPILAVELSDAGIQLGWWNDPKDFKLQWTTDVGSNRSWSDYPEPLPPNPSIKILTVPRALLGTTRYFRLIHPTLPPLGTRTPQGLVP